MSSRTLLLLLVFFCSSLRAEYRWSGSEWVWVEEDRKPLSPAVAAKEKPGGGGGSGDGANNFDDDYGDEDADGGNYADGDDDDDDDYYVNYEQKGKKSDGRGGNKGGKITPVAPKGGKGLGQITTVLPGGQGPQQDKSRPGKADKEQGKGNKKTTAAPEARGKPESPGRRGQQQPPVAALPPALRGKGGGGASFIQTDDEDLVEGSGDDAVDEPYWDSGSGGGAPPFSARDPVVTDATPDIDLDLEDNKNAGADVGGEGKAWNVDSTWVGTTQDTKQRSPVKLPPRMGSGSPGGFSLAGGGGSLAGGSSRPGGGNDDQFDYGDEDEEDDDEEDVYSDGNPVDNYDDDGLSATNNNNDDISIDESTHSTASTPLPPSGRFPTTAAPAAASTVRTTVFPVAPSVVTMSPPATPPVGSQPGSSGGDNKSPAPDTPIISDMLPNNRPVSFFAQPGILAAVIGGAVVGLLCAILLVMFIVYRMRKKDEGSYILDEPTKRTLAVGNPYAKTPNKEFYA